MHAKEEALLERMGEYLEELFYNTNHADENDNYFRKAWPFLKALELALPIGRLKLRIREILESIEVANRVWVSDEKDFVAAITQYRRARAYLKNLVSERKIPEEIEYTLFAIIEMGMHETKACARISGTKLPARHPDL